MRFHKTTIRWIDPIFALCFLLVGTGAHSFSNEPHGQNLVMAWNAEYRTPLMSLSPSEFLDRSFWARIIFERDEQGRVTRFVWRDTDDYPAAKIK